MTSKIDKYEITSQWDYENGFYLTSHPTRIMKLAAHYELYKSISDLPGDVVEFGVFKGASLIRFCTFRDALESPHSRKIIGFDAFGKFPRSGDIDDTAFVEKFENEAGDGLDRDTIYQALTLKGLQNFELVAGDIMQTLPVYIAQNPALRVSLLHIDVDVYEPTKLVLDLLYERMVRGGVIVFDDYSIVSGETRAIDEFLSDKSLRLQKLSISHRPSFLRKL